MPLTVEHDLSYQPCMYCTDLATHTVSRDWKVCDLHIQRAVNAYRKLVRMANGEDE